MLQIQNWQVAPNTNILELSGKLAIGRESEKVQVLVDEFAAGSERNLIFDMTALEYIDSSGIGMVAHCAGKMRESGGKLAIVALDGRVKQIFKMTRIDLIVPIYSTVEAAREALSGKAGLTQPPASV